MVRPVPVISFQTFSTSVITVMYANALSGSDTSQVTGSAPRPSALSLLKPARSERCMSHIELRLPLTLPNLLCTPARSVGIALGLVKVPQAVAMFHGRVLRVAWYVDSQIQSRGPIALAVLQSR